MSILTYYNINAYTMNIYNNYSSSICTKKFYKNVKTLCNIFMAKKLSKTAKMPIIHNFHCFWIIWRFVYILQKSYKSYIISLKQNFYNLKMPKIKNFTKWIMPKSMNNFNTLACCCANFFNFSRQKVFVFIKNHWFYEQIWQEKVFNIY